MRSLYLFLFMFLFVGAVQAKDVPEDVQATLCVNTKNNNTTKVLGISKYHKVNLKRDFNRIYCNRQVGYEGGNLFQTAFHYDRFKMIKSFLYEHKLSINVLDHKGNTLLDWVDFKIQAFIKEGDEESAEEYGELREELLAFGAKNKNWNHQQKRLIK